MHWISSISFFTFGTTRYLFTFAFLLGITNLEKSVKKKKNYKAMTIYQFRCRFDLEQNVLSEKKQSSTSVSSTGETTVFSAFNLSPQQLYF